MNNSKRKSGFAAWNKTREKRLIKIFGLEEETVLNQTQINLFLAQKIIKNLSSLKDLNSLKESYLNRINFNSFDQIKVAIADSLTEDLSEILYHIVLLSKTTDLVNLASSNAITFLNKAKFSFVNKDFSNVKIPNSDLSHGMFINTNFESSNLFGVNFSMAHLYDSNFKNCNMTNADFGIKHLKLGLRAAPDYLEFSACGRFLAVAVGKIIVLYDQKTYKKINQFIEHSSKVNKLLFSNNGNYLASWSNESVLILWDTFSMVQVSKFEDAMVFFDFSPCSNYICLAWHTSKIVDSLIKIYDINSKVIVKEIGIVWFNLMSAFFSQKGANLITLSGHINSISVLDISTETVINEVICINYWPMTVSKDRKYIFLYNYALDIINIYCAEKFEIIRAFKANARYTSWFSCCSYGRYLAWLSKKRGINVFDLDANETIFEIFPNKNWQNKTISLCKNQLIVGTSDKRAKSWKIPVRAELNKKILTRTGIRIVSFSQDNNLFAVVAEEGWIFIFLKKSQKLLQKFQLLKQKIACISWSWNILAIAGSAITFWDVYSGLQLKEIYPHHRANFIEFSPDTKKLLYCIKLAYIAIWDIDRDKKITKWNGNGSSISACRWSRCGNYVLATGFDKTLKILKADNLELLTKLMNSEMKIDLMSISACGKYLLSCSIVKKVAVWYLEKNVTEAKIIQKYCKNNVISSIAWTSDGKAFIIGDVRGKVIIHEFLEKKFSKAMFAHKGTVTSLDFSANENLLITGSKDQTVKLWDFDKLHQYTSKNKTKA